MKLIVFLSVCFAFISVGFSQDMVSVNVLTTDFKTDKKDGGVTIKVYEGSKLINTLISPANGKVDFQVPVGKIYKVEASKAGKVSRYININSKDINAELLPANTSPSVTFSIGLFEQSAGVDYSYVTSNPTTEFYFDGSSPELQYDETVAKRMSSKIDKLLKESEASKGKSDAEYNTAIQEADGFYKQKKYTEALASYEKALAIKPAEQHPNQRLLEIDGILKAEKANNQQNAQIEQEYQNLIMAADNLFNQKKYEEAIVRYNEALTKKQEQHPKDQIVKANAEIVRLKKEAETAGKYTDAIKAADGFMAQKSFMAAKDKYKEALKYKASDAYATGKLTEIDGKLNAQKAEQDKKQKYEDANAAGDALFEQQKWTEAKAKYNEALAIEPSSAYTVGKIKEVDTKLSELEKEAAKTAQVNKLLGEANTAFTSSQWTASKTKYQEVLKLEAQNAIATARIAEIDLKLGAEKADAEKGAKIKQLIAEGDALSKQTKLPEAKAKYQEAIALKPDGAVQAKIDALEVQLAAAGQKAEQKALYEKAMKDGESLFAVAKYDEAKTKFKEAQTIDPAQALPKQRIIDTDKKLAEALAVTQKAEKYTAAMNAGNSAFDAKQLTEAKAKFQEAIAIDGTKPDAKTRLAAVEALLANDAKAKENQLKYDAAVKAGNDFMLAKKLNEAKAKFQEAGTIDPAQSLPKQKITEIESLLAQVEKQKQIELLLKEGNTALSKKDLVAARAKYQQVLGLDPANTNASEKLQEVAKLENEMAGAADKEARFKQLKEEAVALMGQTKYQEAKQKLTETKAIKTDASVDQLIKDCDTKIAAQLKNADNEKQYTAFMNEAQSLETAKQYDQAITKYNEALKIKNEQLPKDRIAAINQIKSGNAAQVKIGAEYAALMKKGDDAFAVQNYVDAIQFYNQALAKKPAEKDPVTKAAEAQRLETAKGDDFLMQYQKVLDVAQKSMAEKNYTKAKELYNRAITLKSDDPFPKQKLLEIDALMKSEKETQDKQMAYGKKIAEAEDAASAGKLENAINLFQQAKKIKPDEVLPDNRIAEIRTKIDGNNAAGAALEKRYQALITEGNAAVVTKDYQLALGKYQEALTVKKNDKPAQDKIAEMRQLLDDLAKANTKKNDVQKLIAQADREFNASKWLDAKSEYEKILVIDPSNAYSKQRIAQCDANAKRESTESDNYNYQKIIAKADENFDLKDYDKAKDYYNRALTFRASDPYPKKRLVEIDAILNPTTVNVVTNNTEPKALPDLGDPNNSLANEALQRAETERNKRKRARFHRKMDEATKQNDSLTAQDEFSTTTANLALKAVEKKMESDAISAETNHAANNQKIIDEGNAIVASENESAQYELAENLDAKSQLNAATTIASDENGVLGGSAVENAEIIKKTSYTLTDEDTQTSLDAHATRVDNQVQFMTERLIEERIDKGDMESRLRTEDAVRQTEEAVIAIDRENQKRTDASLEAVEQTLETVAKDKSAKDYEDSKQAAANNERILNTEKAIIDMNGSDYANHVSNSLEVRKSIEKTEITNADATIKSDESRLKNVDVMQAGIKSQDELDRQNASAMLVRSLNTEEAITQERLRQDDADETAVKSVNDNAEQLKIIATEKQNQTEAADKKEYEKGFANQQTLNITTQKIETDAVQGTARAADNDALLKQTQSNLNTDKEVQAKAQENKNQASRQLIAAIEKKEIIYNDKVANDLGKLYPEGVSQEQFEQNDKEGLLEAVVTRRVVVKNGHGNIYVRTQRLGGLTYSKNGQPTTEYTWQRETQDAALVKNY